MTPDDLDDQPGKENSFERRLNIECLKEAKRYDLPIIPFPYQQQAATPTVQAAALPAQILSAATEGPPINSHRNYRRPAGPTAIPRRLNFEDTPSLVVKALATPSINRRVPAPHPLVLPVPHPLVLPEMMPPKQQQHCSSCTCNQAVVGIPTVRREMISDMVDFGGVSTQRNFLPWRLSGFSLDGGGGCNAASAGRYSNGTDASPRGLNNNQDCSSNQQDYVKMSAKLF